MQAMCSFIKRRNNINTIDKIQVAQYEKECNYWKEVLKRVVATVKLLAFLGLPFRGHDESATSSNKGNFLTCLNYLSEFDDFLKHHLEKYQYCGSGRVNFLSHQTYNEFLSIMSNQLVHSFTEEVKNAKYFSIIVDSTPDCSRIDQLTFILRYVSEGKIIERFFGFVPISCHTAEHLETVVLDKLKSLDLDIKNARGQSFDNAANMAGQFSGLQARLKRASPTAFFIPCSSHSLNLVGKHAAESCRGAQTFFNFVQNVFTFLSASTHRWNKLQTALEEANKIHSENILTIKKINDTRWSARADAVLALKKGYPIIKKVLIAIANDSSEKKIYKIEAETLAKKFEKYETAVLTIAWNCLLQRINKVSKSLQNIECNILYAVNLLDSLATFIVEVRNSFSSIEEEAINLGNVNTCENDSVRLKRRKLFADENTDHEVILEGRQKFIVQTFNVICDNLKAEIDRRKTSIADILNLFKIFFSYKTMTEQAKTECIKKLTELYQEDIDEDYFQDELNQFLTFSDNENCKSPTEMYNLINNGYLKETFSNVETVLKIFLTLPVSNASGERSFSVMKRIKNFSRNSLSQDNFGSASILAIENAALNNIQFDDIINDFVSKKCRKKNI